MGADLVVIGSSWGGAEALREVLGALPVDYPAAVAIAQHRSPGSRGVLTHFLQKHCSLPVREADDKDPVVPGTVYLAPADYHLLVEGGAFALTTDEMVQYSRPSVDVLFETAAHHYGARVVGVVLTGANEDGADGIVAIHARGGHTVAQSPDTCERPEMPAAAIATGAVDVVLPLADIGPHLVALSRQRTGAQR